MISHSKKGIVSLLLAVVMFLSSFSGFMSSAEGGKDVTGLVKVDPIDMLIINGSTETKVIENGIKVPNAPDIKVGDSVELKYYFHIGENELKKIEAGDYFEIKLPDNKYIATIEGVRELSTNGGTVLGTYTIKDGILKTVFNELGADQDGEDGWFVIDGSAKAEGNDISIPAGDGGNINITIKPPANGGGTGGGGNDHGKAEMPYDKIKFTKDGKQYLGHNRLNWHLNVNYDGLKDMVEGKSLEEKKNVVLVDDLPQDVYADIKSVYITVPLFSPTPNNSMSGYAIAYPKVSYSVLKQNPGETYEGFYKRLKEIKNGVTVGVYSKDDGSQSVFFAFGDLPGNGLTYADLLGGQEKFDELVNDHVKSGDITKKQAERMKEVYGPKGTSKGQILGYDVSFDTFVDGENGLYENSAQLNWNTVDEDHSKFVIAFHKTDAGIEVGKTRVHVRKEWIGKKAEQIKVNLLADGVIKETRYLNDANGWEYTFKDLDTHTKENKHIEYTIEEDGVDDKDYVKINDTWYKVERKRIDAHEITITNKEEVPPTPMVPPTRDVKVTKEWKSKDGSVMEGPVDSIKVALYRDGNPTGDTKELKKANGWTETFLDLPVYESLANTKNYEYTIKEVDENNQFVEAGKAITLVGKIYNVSYTGDMATGLKVENKEETPPPTPPVPPTRDVKVTKEWKSKDGSVMKETPVDRIEVELYKNGVPTGERKELGVRNGWEAVFGNLPVYESLDNQKKYEYTIKEVNENDNTVTLSRKIYKVSYTGTMDTGLKVVNEGEPPSTPNTPPSVQKRDIKVKKEWKLNNGSSLVAPVSKVEVELYKDGVATGKILELNSNNGWSAEFKDLDVSDKIGSSNYYKYTVKEIGETKNSIRLGEGWYKVSYDGNMKDGFTITNKKDVPPPTPNLQPKISESSSSSYTSNVKKLPQTGDGLNVNIYTGLVALVGLVILLVGLKFRKEN